jgi:type I restriction enzyme, R subunit
MAGAAGVGAERAEAEQPFIDQLVAMGWQHVHGPDLSAERDGSYRDVLLTRRLAAALRRINRLPMSDAEWVEEPQVRQAVDDLRRASRSIVGQPLLDANREVTRLLLHGTYVKGHEAHHRGRDARVDYLD